MVITPDGTRVYVLSGNSSVRVIDTSSNTVVDVVGLAALLPFPSPWISGLAVTPEGSRLYLPDWLGRRIVVLSTATQSIVTTIPWDPPSGVTNETAMAIAPGGRNAFFSSTGYILVLDTNTHNVVTRIEAPGVRGGMEISPDGRFLYVSAGLNGYLINAQNNQVLGDVPDPVLSPSRTFSPDGLKLYLLNAVPPGHRSVNAYSTDTFESVGVASFDEQPHDIAISTDGNRAYVVASGPSSILVLNTVTNTLIARIPIDIIGGSQSSIALVPSQAVPTFSSAGVVNAASFTSGAPVAPGSIVSVFGSDLSTTTASGDSLPLPTSLAGTSAPFGGRDAPLFFVSSGQINMQVPWELAGQAQTSLAVTAAGRSSPPETVNVATHAPGIFQLDGGQGVILISNTAIVAAPTGAIPGIQSHPANPGDYLTIYATGLGPVTNQPPTGSAALAAPISQTTDTASVTIGGVAAPVLFSGLAPGFVALYQVNVQVPPDTPAGSAVPVVLSIGGAVSNAVSVAIGGGNAVGGAIEP
jgi:uncharacterized protein (TIGR03437 family)